MTEAQITKDLLDTRFCYDIEAGTLTWKSPGSHRAKKGDAAGWVDSEGYRKVSIEGKTFRVHRILFFLAHGRWPKEVDHLNGDKSDNRRENIRESDRICNNRNRRVQSNNTSGVNGIRWVESKKVWRAEFKCIDFYKSKVFKCIEDGIAWRNNIMEQRAFGPNHGRAI